LSGSGHSRPLKILHVDPERNWGGGEAQVFGLLSWLSAKGHLNDLVAHPNGPLIAKCAGLARRCRTVVVRNDLDLRCVPGLRRLIRAGAYDIVHLHTKRAHALSLWLPRGEPVPKFLVTRRMDYPERRTAYTDYLYNRRVDGVVAISQSIAKLLIAAGVDEQKIRVIPDGIDPGPFADVPGVPRPSQCTESITVIGSVGILEERKGHICLLKAAARLKAKGLRLRYRIAGAGSLRQQLERQAASLGLNDDVEFLGFVHDTPAFLAAIDLFVMPSLFEGLGVAALEAMAAGKPVIASRVGGLAESVVDDVTGLLVRPGDDAQLAAAIEKLHRDPARAAALGRDGRERVQRQFSLERMALGNEAYYYELLGAAN
jgi:glycosyltransferase involved in cell wall biosynthesis